MESENLSRIKLLSERKDWTMWKFQIGIILKSMKVFKIVSGQIDRPSGDTADISRKQDSWDDLDMRAQRTIVTTCSSSTLVHMVNCSTSKEMWLKLHSVFEQKSLTGVQNLQQNFYNAVIEPGQDIVTFISILEAIVRELKDQGENISESMIITKILNSLPTTLAHFQSAWDSTDEKNKTVDNLRTRLQAEEQRLQLRDLCSGENALLAKKTKQNKFHKNQKKPGKCFICGKDTHWRKDCPDKPTNSGHKSTETNEKFDKKSSGLCCQSISEALLGLSDSESWYLDSGATEHMSPKREFFSTYAVLNSKHPVRIGNGDFMFAVGIGEIEVFSYNGEKWLEKHLVGVLHVPELHTNLFSQGSVLDKGGKMTSNKSQCEFTTDEGIVAVGKREKALYKMLIKVRQPKEICANVAKRVENIHVWHERLAHQHLTQVKKFLSANKIDFKNCDRLNCEACIYGKAHRLKFPKRETKVNKCGEVVCADVCGPLEVKSLGDKKYFLLMKDEFSHFRTVYFIKRKDEVPDLIKKFIMSVKNEFGHKIIIFRSDNGTEFVNKSVQTFLDKEGIKHERTVPYTPQQNGLAEREMRTIVEAARTMLHSRRLNLALWAEAVNTAVYVINRTGTSTMENKTPYELWCGKRACVDDFKIFGETVYTHIPKEKRSKLDKKADKCIFVGYSEVTKGVRVYDKETNTVKVVRDVYYMDSNDIDLVDNNLCETNEEEEVVIRLSFDTDKQLLSLENHQQDDDMVGHDQAQDESFESASGDVTTIDLLNSSEENVDDVSMTGTLCNVTNRNVLEGRLRSEAESSANFSMCKNVFYSHDIALLAWTEEPNTYIEAIKSENKTEWIMAMNNEYESLVKNNTWVLVNRPENQQIIDNKWVFKIKEKPNGQIERFKARLVARGFTQTHGVDYFETFSPVVKFTSVRTILALAAFQNMQLLQFDIKTAFLNGELNETVFMKQPVGYNDGTDKVCKLVKSLYGLKQASRAWNEKFTNFIEIFGFKASDADPCVFVCNKDGETIILAIYVDDGLMAATNEKCFKPIIEHLEKQFEVKFFQADCYLGIQIHRSSDGSIHINQKAYANKTVNRFGLADANAVVVPVDQSVLSNNTGEGQVKFPYRQAIGSLMYLAIGTRPDICYAVNLLSRFMENPSQAHVTAVKRVIRYIKGTSEYGIFFETSNHLKFSIYSDADFAGCTDTRKSTTGYCILLNSSIISWCSEKQKSVSLSTTESEYISASQSIREMIWIYRLLKNLGVSFSQPVLFVDNQSAIKLIKNPELHKRSKHIDVKYHFIREKLREELFDLKYVKTDQQLADIFTKSLPRNSFEKLRDLLKIIKL